MIACKIDLLQIRRYHTFPLSVSVELIIQHVYRISNTRYWIYLIFYLWKGIKLDETFICKLRVTSSTFCTRCFHRSFCFLRCDRKKSSHNTEQIMAKQIQCCFIFSYHKNAWFWWQSRVTSLSWRKLNFITTHFSMWSSLTFHLPTHPPTLTPSIHPLFTPIKASSLVAKRGWWTTTTGSLCGICLRDWKNLDHNRCPSLVHSQGQKVSSISHILSSFIVGLLWCFFTHEHRTDIG